jgi:Acetyltransferase (GNAT) domain
LLPSFIASSLPSPIAFSDMDLQIVNPLHIPNWDDLVLATGKASFFHSSAWARVLHESYCYKPVYFTLFEGGKLSYLMPFMEVNSWITGKRGVSLPFTDQIGPIVGDGITFDGIIEDVVHYGEKVGWKYIEWRDGKYFGEGLSTSEFYYTHELNLSRPEKELFSGLRDSTRRNIKKAVKAGVSVEISQSMDSIKSFYRLNCVTRKRHGLPPQPFSFFKKVFEHVISKGYGFVASAMHSGKVIASAVFFRFGKSTIYKYGASDMAYQDLRPNNLVMWEAIKWCGAKGFRTFNFGRSEPENHGLLQFKRGWGAKEIPLRYLRYDLRKKVFRKGHAESDRLIYKTFARTPVIVLSLLGRVLYRHAG